MAGRHAAYEARRAKLPLAVAIVLVVAFVTAVGWVLFANRVQDEQRDSSDEADYVVATGETHGSDDSSAGELPRIEVSEEGSAVGVQSGTTVVDEGSGGAEAPDAGNPSSATISLESGGQSEGDVTVGESAQPKPDGSGEVGHDNEDGESSKGTSHENPQQSAATPPDDEEKATELPKL